MALNKPPRAEHLRPSAAVSRPSAAVLRPSATTSPSSPTVLRASAAVLRASAATPRAARRVFVPLALLLCGLAGGGCDGGSGGGGDPGGGPGAPICDSAALIAQCPVGANPIVGAQAQRSCESAFSPLIESAEGHIEGLCQGTAGCHVLCMFADPCRCGIAQLSRDGVVCTDCSLAAACGNDLCEPGETPENCPIDCGQSCTAGERRCDGEILEVCSLQGRHERLPCARDEYCAEEVPGEAQCVRRTALITGGDAGVYDDEDILIPDGRTLRGEAPMPEIHAQAGPSFPVETAEWQQVHIGISGGLSTANEEPFDLQFVGALPFAYWYAPQGAGGAVYGLGQTNWGQVLLSEAGHRFTAAQPTEATAGYDAGVEAAFCDACADCETRLALSEESRAALLYDDASLDWWRQCLVAQADPSACNDGGALCCAAIPPQDPPLCALDPQRGYPHDLHIEGRTFSSGAAAQGAQPLIVQRGDQLLALGRREPQGPLHLLRWSLTEPEGILSPPIPLYQPSANLTLSADGRTAALSAHFQSDGVIFLWHIEENRLEKILPRIGQWGALSLSPDGQVLAVAAASLPGQPEAGQSVSLWHLGLKQRIVSILGVKWGLFSPNGAELALATAADVEIWSAEKQPRRLHLLDTEPPPVLMAEYAPDGRHLALNRQASVSLWDTQSGERKFYSGPPPALHSSVIEHSPPRFSADGQRLLTGVRLYNADGRSPSGNWLTGGKNLDLHFLQPPAP